ncbi:uncharacterized protein LOC116337245 isoform X1 [Contarinia nasturtii]|uniref:uncharacterized protein LOC116337245 isoform X1 n=1 Tax=Contarinia nasturtii TaxID=265458 RepID=UPI0012D4715F|nr:uncharacterized protein LOC116337245 isoform X1 [Contarinia nasturtii]
MASSQDSGGSVQGHSSGQSSSGIASETPTRKKRSSAIILQSPTGVAINNMNHGISEISTKATEAIAAGDVKKTQEVIDVIEIYKANITTAREFLCSKIQRIEALPDNTTPTHDISGQGTSSVSRMSTCSPCKRPKTSDSFNDWSRKLLNITSTLQTEALTCEKLSNLKRLLVAAKMAVKLLTQLRDDLKKEIEQPEYRNQNTSGPSSSSHSSDDSEPWSTKHPFYEEFVAVAKKINKPRALRKILSELEAFEKEISGQNNAE